MDCAHTVQIIGVGAEGWADNFDSTVDAHVDVQDDGDVFVHSYSKTAHQMVIDAAQVSGFTTQTG